MKLSWRASDVGYRAETHQYSKVVCRKYVVSSTVGVNLRVHAVEDEEGNPLDLAANSPELEVDVRWLHATRAEALRHYAERLKGSKKLDLDQAAKRAAVFDGLIADAERQAAELVQ